MHLHETEKEIEDSLNEIGVRPAEFFESIGAFDVPVTAAHCVHLTEQEMKMLNKHNVTVAVNLTSNLKLASGIPDLPGLFRNGVNVSFGTDGCASNNNLNIFEEMHIAGILYKGIYKDPTLISPRSVIKAATLGRKIEEGENADVILIDMAAAHLTPVNDIDALIFLRDPMEPKAHEPNVNDVVRLCDTHNIPMATNLATAELIVLALDRGDLDWREMYK
mgnify:CR=1 FL=1